MRFYGFRFSNISPVNFSTVSKVQLMNCIFGYFLNWGLNKLHLDDAIYELNPLKLAIL